MPRAKAPTLDLPKPVPRAVACEHLGISPQTFGRHWDEVFTDYRPRPADPKELRGRRRKVMDDELRVAVENGGDQDRARAAGAVLAFRRQAKRV